MIKKKKLIKYFLNIILIFFLGCGIAYREFQIKRHVDLYPKSSKKSISVIVSGKVTVDGKEMGKDLKFNRIKSDWVDYTNKAYKDCRIFPLVRTIWHEDKHFTKRTDFIAEVNILNNGISHWSSCISVLTLGILPGKGKEEIIVTTKIKDSEGNILKVYNSSDVIIEWYQIFTFLLRPFCKGYKELKREIYYDVNMDVIKKAHNDGIF